MELVKVTNAKSLPKVYYGLHFYPGVAEYREPGADPYRIYIAEDTIKNMGPTFTGRPVYVQHVDQVDLDKLQIEADGYVMESFYNKADGKHWCKFIVVSDEGHEAVRAGWKLSNAYFPKSFTVGGLCNGVEYQKEVTSAEYEHLAIVPNPRYEESVILTPEEFKAYNSQKELELEKLSNSKTKGVSSMKFNFFKKQAVENSADLENMSVTLPKSKKEMTLAQLINDMDTIQNMHGYAANEHMVKLGNDEMSVGDLVNAHMGLLKEKEEMKNKEDEADADAGKAEGEEIVPNAEEDEKAKEDKKENEEKPEDKKKENEDMEDEKAKKNANYKALKNAPARAKAPVSVELSSDKLARGKARYGSN